MKTNKYHIVKNRFTNRYSVVLGPNMYYPWLLDMQAKDPAEDWVFPNLTFFLKVFFKIESDGKGKWETLNTL